MLVCLLSVCVETGLSLAELLAGYSVYNHVVCMDRVEWPMEIAPNSNCSRMMAKARMLSVCGDHATVSVATR